MNIVVSRVLDPDPHWMHIFWSNLIRIWSRFLESLDPNPDLQLDPDQKLFLLYSRKKHYFLPFLENKRSLVNVKKH